MTTPIQVNGYHAHVYYDTATRPVAERLRKTTTAALRCGLARLSR